MNSNPSILIILQLFVLLSHHKGLVCRGYYFSTLSSSSLLIYPSLKQNNQESIQSYEKLDDMLTVPTQKEEKDDIDFDTDVTSSMRKTIFIPTIQSIAFKQQKLRESNPEIRKLYDQYINDEDDQSSFDYNSLNKIQTCQLLLDIVEPSHLKLRRISDHMIVEKMINNLENNFVPIQTIPFLLSTITGNWKLVYSNSIPFNSNSNLEFNIIQSIIPDYSDKNEYDYKNNEYIQCTDVGRLTNDVYWQYREDNNNNNNFISKGLFKTECSYKVTSKGALQLQLADHSLYPEILPLNIDHFLSSLQGTIPFEAFDPNDGQIRHTYIDPFIRIVRISGGQFNQVVNIFTRSAEATTHTDTKDSQSISS
eukprot:gene11141-14950_t